MLPVVWMYILLKNCKTNKVKVVSSAQANCRAAQVSPMSITSLHQIFSVISDKIALNLKSYCFCPTPSTNDLESLSLVRDVAFEHLEEKSWGKGEMGRFLEV